MVEIKAAGERLSRARRRRGRAGGTDDGAAGRSGCAPGDDRPLHAEGGLRGVTGAAGGGFGDSGGWI